MGTARSADILTVDDSSTTLRILRQALEMPGHRVWTATTPREALEIAKSQRLDLAFVDLHLESHDDGLLLLQELKRVAPQVLVYVMTAGASVESAISAFKLGAYDYLLKPVHVETLHQKVVNAIQLRDLGQERARARQEVQRLREQIQQEHAFSQILGTSRAMRELRQILPEVSQTDSTVLVTGESGTGKSLLARLIHFNSQRRDAPYVEANCVVYADTLLNSELFGHEKGAFTGAIKQRKGRFELADGGSLFLDEIGDLKPSTQVLLLRVLQDQRFERVGGNETLSVDVRVLAATNRDLTRQLETGELREDLFYRLNVIPIHLPALRERQEDIPLLAGCLLQDLTRHRAAGPATLSDEALERIGAYSWPGNIRELQNALEYALVFTKNGTVEASHLPPAVRSRQAPREAESASHKPRPTLDELERDHILRILVECGQNKKLAAEVLGIQRSTLYAKLRRHGLGDAPA